MHKESRPLDTKTSDDEGGHGFWKRNPYRPDYAEAPTGLDAVKSTQRGTAFTVLSPALEPGEARQVRTAARRDAKCGCVKIGEDGLVISPFLLEKAAQCRDDGVSNVRDFYAKTLPYVTEVAHIAKKILAMGSHHEEAPQAEPDQPVAARSLAPAHEGMWNRALAKAAEARARERANRSIASAERATAERTELETDLTRLVEAYNTALNDLAGRLDRCRGIYAAIAHCYAGEVLRYGRRPRLLPWDKTGSARPDLSAAEMGRLHAPEPNMPPLPTPVFLGMGSARDVLEHIDEITIPVELGNSAI